MGAREYKGLTQVLLAEQRKPDLAQTILFHADSNAAPLKCASPDLTSADSSKSVAVVFAPNGRKEEIAGVGTSVASYLHVAIDNASRGVAFVQMMHNEGFLIGAAQALHCGLTKPASDIRSDVAESQPVTRCPSSSTLVTLNDIESASTA